MPADKYRFISPGVFTTEIDQSQVNTVDFEQRGPVVIGRSVKGPAFLPTRVHSYEQFVKLFGEPVAGGDVRDAWRNPSQGSPMYSTYAAEAYLRNNQPLTFVRVLGAQSPDATSTTVGVNGWNAQSPTTAGGGAYGLFVFPSGSVTSVTGTLAAIWYCNSDASLILSGNISNCGRITGMADATTGVTQSNATMIESTANGSPSFKTYLNPSNGTAGLKTFNFSVNDANFIRNVFNTDPTQLNTNLYPSGDNKGYFLGQTFERAVSALSATGKDEAPMIGLMLQLQNITAETEGGDFRNLKDADFSPPTAKSGWFVSQDLNTPASGFTADNGTQRLFRLHGLYDSGHETQNKVKISIRDLRFPTAQEQTVDPYPTFTVEVRHMADNDREKNVLETFSGLNLNPASINYIAARIGDKYMQYNITEQRLETRGDYDNKSNHVRVEVHNTVAQGGGNPSFMPFGVLGPPKFADFTIDNGGFSGGKTYEVGTIAQDAAFADALEIVDGPVLSGSPATNKVDFAFNEGGSGTAASMTQVVAQFPSIPLVQSASVIMGTNGQLNAYFGADLMESAGNRRLSSDIVDLTRVLPAGLTDSSGVATLQYKFTLDNIVRVSSSGAPVEWIYQDGARAGNFSYTAASGAAELVNTADINKFTTVLYGGFDGFDIRELDPFRNTLLANTNVMPTIGGSTEVANYAVHSLQRAINIVTDAEFVDYNLATIPGITHAGLTDNLIDVCEDRGDALAIVDIQNDYQPRAEGASDSYPKLPNVTDAINSWKIRSTDSSYGSAFFPWVQTRDRRSGQLLWIPPSVAALGTMGSSAARSELWFAPAGFNRGGLTQGSAGIPVTNVRKKLTSKNRDKLYEHRINPIASFPTEGIVVFGQKTCQVQATALDRINVRRLLIYLKKRISTIANNLLFDQNVPATWARFKGQVEPLLSDVQTRFGLSDYKLVLDETTTTPDLIDRNVMYAKVYLKPARAIEFIALDFYITSTGASFED